MHYDEIPVHLHGFHCPRSTFVVPREKSGSNCGKFQVGYKHYWEIKYYLCHIIIIYTINFIYNSMNTDTDWEGAREALHTWQRLEQELWKSNIFYNQPRKAKHGISSQRHQYHQYRSSLCLSQQQQWWLVSVSEAHCCFTSGQLAGVRSLPSSLLHFTHKSEGPTHLGGSVSSAGQLQ